MRISIVVPSYNQAQFLPYTLDSILNQNYQDIEVIVMDGGSTDGSVAVLESYQDERLRWESKPDKGQSDAINQGMRQATGDILAYLNSDDAYLSDTIPYVMNYFNSHPDVDLLCGATHTIDANNHRTGKSLRPHELNYRTILTRRMTFPQQSAFWRRSIKEAIGLFDETLHFRMDYDYWIRAIVAGFKYQHVDDFLAEYRVHETSKSLSQEEKFWKDWYTILDKLYAMDDLPQEVIDYQKLAYSYASLYAGTNLYRHNQRQEAQSYLKKFLLGEGAFQQKTYATTMYFDCLFGIQLTPSIVRLYRLFKGTPVEDV